MKLFLAVLMLIDWYYIPFESPSAPVEVEGVDMNLKRNESAFTFFSLSDGEAMLIQHANGDNVLVNTGGKGVEKELDRLLALFHVKMISTVILTSAEGRENLQHIINSYKVRKIVTGTASEKMDGISVPAGVKRMSWEQDSVHTVMPGLTAEVVYDGKEEQEGTDLSFQFFSHQIFYMSSYSLQSEKAFRHAPLENVNIFKVPAYAAKGSFSDQLIDHLDPQLAIIFKSGNVKPDPDLVELLHEAWIDVYLTKQHGTITIKLTDSNYDVITILSKSE
jgi:competence protein ComEC